MVMIHNQAGFCGFYPTYIAFAILGIKHRKKVIISNAEYTKKSSVVVSSSYMLRISFFESNTILLSFAVVAHSASRGVLTGPIVPMVKLIQR